MNQVEFLKTLKEMSNNGCTLNIGDGKNLHVNVNDAGSLYEIFKCIPNTTNDKPYTINKVIVERNIDDCNTYRELKMWNYVIAYGLWLKIYLNRDVFVYFKDGKLVK